MTEVRQCSLKRATPYLRMSRRPESFSSVSECSSAGRPWQSQPKRRSTSLAAHRLVARHQVLHEAGDDVAVVRQAVGEGRAVIEDELRRALVAPPVDRALEGLLLPPIAPAPPPRASGRTAGSAGG